MPYRIKTLPRPSSNRDNSITAKNLLKQKQQQQQQQNPIQVRLQFYHNINNNDENVYDTDSFSHAVSFFSGTTVS